MEGAEAVKKKVVEKVKPKRTTFSEILLGESRVMCRYVISVANIKYQIFQTGNTSQMILI